MPPLARLNRAEECRPGKLLQNREQEDEDQHGPDHQARLDAERPAGRVLLLKESQCQGKHGELLATNAKDDVLWAVLKQSSP